ncbi:MAG: MFS transporter, partial [Chloroflexi bacterium]|nr:MFS transporter [Chloroflexota bacterium]
MAELTETSQADSRPRFRRLLTTQGFLVLVISNGLGLGGEQMRIAAQSYWILDSGGSNTAVGLAAGLRFIPVILISLYAGVMIDRFGGKRVLLVERGLLVLLALVTALFLLSDGIQVWHIVALSTIAGATIAIGMPATETLVPEIVPSDLRPSANLLNQLGPSAGRTLGPLLAGILIAVRGVATAFFGLVAVYVVAVVMTMRLPASPAKAAGSGSAVRQIVDGIRYIRRTPLLFWVLTLQLFSLIFFGMMFPLIPAIAFENLDASEFEFGLLWGALAIGQAATAIVLAVMGGISRNAISLVAAAAIYTIFVIPAALTHDFWLAFALLAGLGIAFPLWVAAQ